MSCIRIRKPLSPILPEVLLVLVLFNAGLGWSYAQVAGNPYNWLLEADQDSALYGISVGGGGDFNGDGYDDLIVGSPWHENQAFREGAAFFYYGSPLGVSNTPDWVLESGLLGGALGVSTAFAGDVNGDGYDDLLVNILGYEPQPVRQGRILLIYGSASGISQNNIDTIDNPVIGDDFGLAISTAGDVNGDGYDDILIGFQGYRVNNTVIGSALAYYGGPNGIADTIGWWEEGDQFSSAFGISVNTAGDVNGDGFDDVIVGASAFRDTVSGQGKIYVYYGSSQGLDTIPAWTFVGTKGGEFLGASVCSGGDVNNDGYDDIVVGAWGYTDPYTHQGAAFAFYGSSSGLDSVANWSVKGDIIFFRTGQAVAGLGDINQDGYDDVVIGSWYAFQGENSEGVIDIYFGGPTGLASTKSWRAEGNQDRGHLGVSVSSAGDVNGDSYLDFAAGANYYDHPEIDEGVVFVYSGKNLTWLGKGEEPGSSVVGKCMYDHRNAILTVDLGARYDEVNASWVNVSGQVVSQAKYENASTITEPVNLNSGFYLYRVRTEDGKFSCKVVK